MHSHLRFFGLASLALALTASAVRGQNYQVTNLVSDSTAIIPAKLQDPNLVNPWGISFGTGAQGTPFWLSDNNAGVSTVYSLTPSGPQLQILVPVPLPGASNVGTSTGTPTGTVFNPTTGFNFNSAATNSMQTAQFIFDTEDGTLAAWANGNSFATVVVDNSGQGAVYKGLALATGTSQGNLLYATNFNTGHIDVFDPSFHPIATAGTFTDPGNPKVPSPGTPGYAPFNVQNFNNTLFVTYALQDAAQHDDFSAPGTGFVDEYTTSGVFIKRLITGGALDSPWGLAMAPSTFGKFANDLLVGNFGNSRINAFDPTTGAFLGNVTDSLGNPALLSNATDVPGLWGLAFGNGTAGFDPNTLYFTSGDNAQFDGLFGAITAVPEPTAGGFLLGLAAFMVRRRHR
jgi:uncharacterized protein (TIGR03118 family)